MATDNKQFTITEDKPPTHDEITTEFGVLAVYCIDRITVRVSSDRPYIPNASPHISLVPILVNGVAYTIDAWLHMDESGSWAMGSTARSRALTGIRVGWTNYANDQLTDAAARKLRDALPDIVTDWYYDGLNTHHGTVAQIKLLEAARANIASNLRQTIIRLGELREQITVQETLRNTFSDGYLAINREIAEVAGVEIK